MYDTIDIAGLRYKPKLMSVWRRLRIWFISWQIKRAYARTLKLLQKADKLGI